MNELQAWLDNAPTLRRASVQIDYDEGWMYSVSVWVHAGEGAGKGAGEGTGRSLSYATIAAIVDWYRLQP